MSILFDASNDYVDCASPTGIDDIFNTSGGTSMAWIFPISVGENGFGRVFDKGNVWLLHMNNSDVTNSLSFNHNFSGTDGFWDFPASTINPYSVWYHIAVTLTTSAGVAPLFYVNGILVTTTTRQNSSGTISSDSGTVMRIGQNYTNTTRTFDGNIADARLYDRVLTADEILTIYSTQGRDGIYSGIRGRWPMDELSEGTTATLANDISDGKSNGTPTNGPVYGSEYITSQRRVA
jgi:hypothetical protein